MGIRRNFFMERMVKQQAVQGKGGVAIPEGV